MPAKWKCINNEAHIFERATNDFLCTYCKQLGELSMIIAIAPPVTQHKTSVEHNELDRPGINQHSSAHPGSEHPGSDHPESAYPGSEHPGSGHPESAYPGSEHPGSEPGSGHPGSEHLGSGHPESAHPESEHPGSDHQGTEEFRINDQQTGANNLRKHEFDLTEPNYTEPTYRDPKSDFPDGIRIRYDYNIGRVSRKEVGLSVLVMDASSSMLEPAFEGSPLSRLSLVAKTAAYGVFDLQHMQNNPNAFVTIIVFDDRVKNVFPDGPVSIASLIKRFDADVHKFALFLEEELGSMKQGTDINAALNEAYWVVSNFMENKLMSIYDGQYSPVQQTILKFGTIDSVSIPNVRVLIYTDGMQYDARENRTLLPNPFSAHPITGLNHDVLIGAYFGQANEDGAAQLSSLVSKCPVHDVRQFFLIDSPTRINSLQSLFRMASGASGFCPKCLESSN